MAAFKTSSPLPHPLLLPSVQGQGPCLGCHMALEPAYKQWEKGGSHLQKQETRFSENIGTHVSERRILVNESKRNFEPNLE